MKKRSIDFKKYSSIKIGPTLEVWIIEREDEDRKEFFIIGGANNLLISDNPPPLAMLSKKYSYIEHKDNKLFIGAATPGGVVHSFCKRYNIGGFEFLKSLPGTIGGMVKMNAGLKKYEIFNNLLAIKTKRGYIPKSEIDFGYRYTDIEDTVFEAVFEIKDTFSKDRVEMFQNLRKNQPKDPSAGSCFKNPKGDYAGRLIEAVGLRGFRVGGAAFSEKHANFLVNINNATFKDAFDLIRLAQKRVYENFGIKLEREIKVL